MALVEIQYPHTWFNVLEEDRTFELGHYLLTTEKNVKIWDHVGSFDLEYGHYPSTNKLVNVINQNLEKLEKAHKTKNRIKFAFNTITQHVQIAMLKNTHLSIPPQIKDMFHLDNVYLESFTSKKNTVFESKYPVDIERGLYTLYVYCDIVQAQIVGNTFVPLLRVVPVTGKYGDRITTNFQDPQYQPLRSKDFDEIEIDIRAGTGKKIPFETGKLLVTLHFRERKNLL